MYKVANFSADERHDIFQNTAARKGMNAAIIEKDKPTGWGRNR